jgi:hypothetical protein
MSRFIRLAIPSIAALAALSCDENLPSGPFSFDGAVRIMTTRDTMVVGDSSVIQARTTDSRNRIVFGLKYTWTAADTTITGFAPINPADSDAVHGRKRTLVGKRPGTSLLALSLPDSRFVTAGHSRLQTVVVGGVRVLSARDTTLSAVNDTGVAIAASLVRVNNALVTRASQGIKWVQKGARTQVIGTGDTIRYVAKQNGADTLIAVHDYCLAGQKCADTVIARVAQQMTLTLSSRAFSAWSVHDSLGPTISLADRRGNGQPGTSVRFVPRTAADSNIVRIVGPFGLSNPTTGAMAVPRAVASRNGTARVLVQGVALDGAVVATDSLTVTVRQVARRVAAEAQRVIMTNIDSVPVRGVARDARGSIIDDATVTLTSVGIPFGGIWAGPTSTALPQGSLVPTLTGVALPANNPGAPQIPPSLDASVITITAFDTAKAKARVQLISVVVMDSLGQAAPNKWVRFGTSNGAAPDSVVSDADGFATVSWTPPSLAGRYTLTGVRGTLLPMATLADSTGRVVMRHSIEVVADDPSDTTSSVQISTTTIAQGGTATITITARDDFRNIVRNVLPAAFSVTPTGVGGGGTVTPLTCVQGVCTTTYTAPAAAGAVSIAVRLGTVAIVNSPINLTIP